MNGITQETLTFYGITAPPEGKTIELIARGYDDGPKAYVHYRRLSEDELRDYSVWAGQADQTLESMLGHRSLLEDLLPGVLILYFPCTCCCGDDLIEINACGYCNRLEGHIDDCPALLPPGSDEAHAAHVAWELSGR